jgi:hypothetical protein
VLAATGQLGMAAAGQIRLAVVTRGPAKKPSSDIDDGLRIAVERGQPSTTVPKPEMVFVLRRDCQWPSLQWSKDHSTEKT